MGDAISKYFPLHLLIHSIPLPISTRLFSATMRSDAQGFTGQKLNTTAISFYFSQIYTNKNVTKYIYISPLILQNVIYM